MTITYKALKNGLSAETNHEDPSSIRVAAAGLETIGAMRQRMDLDKSPSNADIDLYVSHEKGTRFICTLCPNPTESDTCGECPVDGHGQMSLAS